MSIETSVEEAFQKHSDQLEVSVKGKISKLLSDDKEGVHHQRFILTAPSGHTVLILNNLGRSKRLPLELNQNVFVKGQYRWNDHGGLIHETHKDTRIPNQKGLIKLTDLGVRN